MLSRTVSVSSGLSRLATTRSLTATPPLLGKFGNAPRNDEPRDPKKHSYEHDPIPKPTTEKLLKELNDKRWNLLKISKEKASSAASTYKK